MKYQNDLRKRRQVSEANTSSTLASLQFTLTRTLRAIEAYTLKVRIVIREARSIDYRLPA
jgi:hypothetical protein